MIESIDDLVAFLKRFHRHWLSDPSLDPDLVPADLPEGLATIYRELGALVEIDMASNGGRAPFATQDTLVPLSRLARVDGMVEFAWENQGNWSCFCPAGIADPPVYSRWAGGWDTVSVGYDVACESLNHFLTTLCLQEAVMGCRSLAAIDTELPLEQALAIPVQPIWLNGRYASSDQDHHFFVCPERDILVMDWQGLWIGSPTEIVEELVAQGLDVQVLH